MKLRLRLTKESLQLTNEQNQNRNIDEDIGNTIRGKN